MVYWQDPRYMVLRAVNKNNIHIYFINYEILFFKKTDIINFTNFVTCYHAKN